MSPIRPFIIALPLLLAMCSAMSCTEWLVPRPECTGDTLDLCLSEQTLLESLANDTCADMERRVCIVPLGQVSPGLVKHFVDYYQDEYDLTIQILTPTAIPGDLVNGDREQVEADALLAHMTSEFPDVYADSQAVIIGLTPLDLYWDAKPNWRYAFGVRGDFEDPVGLISSARMDPRIYGLSEDDKLYFTRVRKLFSKYVGVLYYGLPESGDRESPMYGNILGPGDLDRMREPLPVR